MRAGKLRHRVEIQVPSKSENPQGETVQGWTSIGMEWAAIEAISKKTHGGEGFVAAQVLATYSHMMTMRYRADVGPRCRILFGQRIFNVSSVDNVDQRNISLTVYVDEEVRK